LSSSIRNDGIGIRNSAVNLQGAREPSGNPEKNEEVSNPRPLTETRTDTISRAEIMEMMAAQNQKIEAQNREIEKLKAEQKNDKDEIKNLKASVTVAETRAEAQNREIETLRASVREKENELASLRKDVGDLKDMQKCGRIIGGAIGGPILAAGGAIGGFFLAGPLGVAAGGVAGALGGIGAGALVGHHIANVVHAREKRSREKRFEDSEVLLDDSRKKDDPDRHPDYDHGAPQTRLGGLA
jgi:archaellum component FlaC